MAYGAGELPTPARAPEHLRYFSWKIKAAEHLSPAGWGWQPDRQLPKDAQHVGSAMGEDRDQTIQLKDTMSLPKPAIFPFVTALCKHALGTEITGAQHQNFWCNSTWGWSRFLHLLLKGQLQAKVPSA